MNINDILKISKLCVMRLTENKKKSINSVLQYGHVVRKHAFVIFTASRFPYVYLCLNLMTVQTSKGKVSHSSKELVRRIMAFEYKNLLLLKSPQNKAAPNIVITEKNKLSQTYNLCQGNYKIKLLVLQMSHCSM